MRFLPAFVVTFVIVLQTVQCYMENEDYNGNILIQRSTSEEIDEKDIVSEYLKGGIGVKQYRPDWTDLDTRPLPEWYDKAKIGIFLHWGVFSVPSFHSEWFWWYWRHENHTECVNFMKKNYPPGFTYQEFAPMFKAEFFEPKNFADLFAKAGAKYVVLTSKHHEGYTLFPSSRSFSWNSLDVGPRRDLVRDLGVAVKEAGLKFGLYHSLYEWFNPLYLADKATEFREQMYVADKLWPDIKQIINDYQPSVLWSDGDWEASDKYWNSTDLLAWLYNESPVRDEIVVNDRWGKDIPCHHGDFYNCEDRYNPGQLQNHKWENAFTLDKDSWGYNRKMNLSKVLTMEEILYQVLSTVSCGGNVLINVGPTKEGTIAPIFEERLLALGEWLVINGEAIYGSSPWTYQNDTLNDHVWYTCTKKRYNSKKPTAKPMKFDTVVAVYATILRWPEKNLLILGDVADLMHDQWQIELLGNEGTRLKWKALAKNRIAILLPTLDIVMSRYAWTLRFKPQASKTSFLNN